MPTDDCPCGGGAYAECCGPAHQGAPVPTAEALMRSRFSAFAVRDADYLLRTWHPSTRPAGLDLPTDRRWTRLRVLATERGGPGDTDGVVEFRAHFRDRGEPGTLTERSRFRRVDGDWFYVDGEVAHSAQSS